VSKRTYGAYRLTDCTKVHDNESYEIKRKLQRAEELKRKSPHSSVLKTPSLDILLLLADSRAFSKQLYWSLNLSDAEVEDIKRISAQVSLCTPMMSSKDQYADLTLKVAKKHAIHNAPCYIPHTRELSYLKGLEIYTKLNRTGYDSQLKTIAAVEPLNGTLQDVHEYKNSKLPYCSSENDYITEIHCETLSKAVQTLFDTSIVHKALCVTEPEGLRTGRSSVAGSTDCLATLIAHIPIKTSRHVYEITFGVKRYSAYSDLSRDQWRFTLTITELAYAYLHPNAHHRTHLAYVRQQRNILSMHWRTISELVRSIEATSYGLDNPDPSTRVPGLQLLDRHNPGSRNNHNIASNWWNLILDSAPDKKCQRAEYLRLCESLIFKLYA